MEEYRAYFKEGHRVKLLHLVPAIVYRVVETRKGNLVACAYTSDNEEIRFVVTSPKGPCGARHKVEFRRGCNFPWISASRHCFAVGENTAVLVPVTKTGRSIYSWPVISYDHHDWAMKKIGHFDPHQSGAHYRRKDHRWVNPPPKDHTGKR